MLEDATHKLYFQRKSKPNANGDCFVGDKQPGVSQSPQRKDYWDDLANRVASEKCAKTHRHVSHFMKTKENDLAALQSDAFRHLVLQKPIDEPTGFDMTKICRASFKPRAPVPKELQAEIDRKEHLKR